jgi:hypothetical protein
MPSSAFDAFVGSYFGDIDATWLNGLDGTVLDKLEGAERDEAERLLLESLGGGDYRVAAGLGILRTQKALEGLKKHLQMAEGKDAVETAMAIYLIAGEEWAKEEALRRMTRNYLDGTMRKAPHEADRRYAQNELRKLDMLERKMEVEKRGEN